MSQTDRSEVIDISSRLELMVDDYLIDRFDGAARLRFHQPVEREVALTCDAPWEGNYSGDATLLQDGDRYRMYYLGGMWPWDPAQSRVCLAESSDGIHWIRPELGLIAFDGSTKNNILMSGEAANTFVPFIDTNPDCVPRERYKALAELSEPTKGLYAYASADGIAWRHPSDSAVITQGYFDSMNVAFWDTVRSRYVEFHRDTRGPDDSIRNDGPQLGYADDGWARDVLTCTSQDFQTWSEPQWLQYPDAPREQLYYNQIIPYDRAPHIFIGFPGRFMAAREIEKALPVASHPAFDHAGVSDTIFMTSRDGVSFKRWSEAFIRPGPRHDRWIYPHTFPCYGLLTTPSPIPDMPDELSIYIIDGGYWAARARATRIRRYALRMDGFVSVNASLRGGEVVTKPLVFSGGELVMNVSTSAAGSVRVEIQDAEGQPLEGFTLADCPEIYGDELERVVSFGDRTDLSQPAGLPVRLRFVIRDADLYAFRFRAG